MMDASVRSAESDYPRMGEVAVKGCDAGRIGPILRNECGRALAEIDRLRVEVERLERRNETQRAALDEVSAWRPGARRVDEAGLRSRQRR